MNFKPTVDEEELRRRFFKLRTLKELAELLDTPASRLTYYAFFADHETHYRLFEIPKKSGGVREIAAPEFPLKIIQWKLNQVLQYVYLPKASVHGFVPGRSILTNARRHLETKTRRSYVFNVDIEDFFPSITYRRVVGLFMAKPYELPKEVAKVIALLCCYKGKLPQGAATSPVISNMICAKMDTQLRRLAQESRCVYARYADDITFSSSLPSISGNIAIIDEKTRQVRAGDALQQIIETNGFRINPKKIRLKTKFNRQEITGLTVNKFPNVPRKYVRQIRAMLHAWEVYGLENAQREFAEKYAGGHRKAPPFKQVVRGKIEYLRMVRGEDNSIYRRFRDKLKKLDPTYKPKDRATGPVSPVSIFVGTEGTTDWKHLKAALYRFQTMNEFTDLNIGFWKYGEDVQMNDAELLKRCRYQSEKRLDTMHIYIFDRDKPDIVREANEPDKDYRCWGNNLFSFAIPVPSHRQETPDVCIELYYLDLDIKSLDSKGRRLFLSTEFDKRSGRHRHDKNLNCTDLNKVKRSLTIIDNAVFNEDSNNVALPKNDFASYILERADGFDNPDITAFRLIFELIRKIVRENPITAQ